jgi:predicted transcriptional regulator/competence protein ComGC
MRLRRTKAFQIKLILILFLISISIVILIPPISTIAEQDTTNSETATASLTSGGDREYKISELGKILYYDFTLRKHQGELTETYQIKVKAESGGSIELSDSRDSSVTLTKDKSKVIAVEIILPDNEIDGYYRFFFNVTSTNMPESGKIIYALVSPEGVILTNNLKPVLVITPTNDYLGIVTQDEPLNVDIEVTCYVESTRVYLSYNILAMDNNKIDPNNDLDISISDAQDIAKGETKKFKLTIQFKEELQNRIENTIRIQIEAKSASGSEITKPVTLRFVARNEPDDNFLIGVIESPLAIVSISSLIILGTIGAAVTSHEAGKYWLLSLLFIPLYTKLHKNKILDHFTRGRVYEYVRNNPGTHYSEIKRELELNNGSLTYHLHTLEREELIKSRTSGRFKVFYPTDVKIPKDMEPQISSIRRQILDIIREVPGITQKELGLRLPNKKQRTISYHVKNMSREGILELKKEGRETKCFIAEKVVDIKQSDQTDGKYSDEEITSEVVFRQI